MNVRDYLSEQELAELTARSDLQAAWLVLCQWLQVAAIFAVMAVWTNPLSILAGVVLLGSRQLGFGILVHECGHRILFASRALNEHVGNWLAAAPTFNDMEAYIRGHLVHHRTAGTHDDPDLPNYQDYPITRKRLRRKLKRDLTGQTGWRTVKAIAGALAKLPALGASTRAALVRAVLVNAALLGVLVAVGEVWLYLMWVAAYVFVLPAISRIRQVSEHAAVPDLYDLDPRLNTRTVRASYLWRAVFSPHGVNYHLEHHILAAVPIYHLHRMHRLLTERGAYDGVHFPTNHVQVLREVTRSDPAPAAA